MTRTINRIVREGRFGRYKSRRRKKQIFVKVPGGRTVVQYREKKTAHARCAVCGAVLKGIACERHLKMKNMAKSRKTVARRYGGCLCSRCARKKIIEGVRR